MSIPVRILIWLVLFLGLAYSAHRKATEVGEFRRKRDFWPMTDLILYIGLRLATWSGVIVALAGAYGIYTQG